jgi:YVTN family beta-propeller protein
LDFIKHKKELFSGFLLLLVLNPLTMKNVFTYLFLTMIVFSCKNSQERETPVEVHNQNDLLLVANKTDNTLHIIDVETSETLHVLETGLDPHEVEITPDGKMAVVTNYGNSENPGNTLSVYDLEKFKLLKTIDLDKHSRPHGIQVFGDSNKMLVTTEGSNSLLLVNIETGTIEKAINTGQTVSHMVAATPDFKKAFVPSISTGNLTVIDLEKEEVVKQLYSGKGAEGIAVSPNGKEVWVTNREDNTLAVFNTSTLGLTHTITCENFPIRLKFTPDGSKALVSNARTGDVAIFDAKDKMLLANVKMDVPLPDEVDDERYFSREFEGSSIPIGIVVPSNTKAYVANTNADLVSEIDLESFTITRHFPTGKQPDGVNYLAQHNGNN